MLFRIDLEHYLTHMVDYFTADELNACQYVIIGTIPNNGRSASNVVKLNELYPSNDTILKYAETHNKELLKGEYTEQLNERDNESIIYNAFINNILQHQNIILLSRREENDWIDVLCNFLEEKFSIECVDLNELFKTGSVGPIHIDRDEIRNRAVDVRRRFGKDMIKYMERTREGREKLLDQMDIKYKIKKCKDLGIKMNKGDIKNIDDILREAWVEEDS